MDPLGSIISFVFLAMGYVYQKNILNWYLLVIYILLAIICTIISLLRYTNNPSSKNIFGLDPEIVITEKNKGDQRFEETFKSKKKHSKIKAKWGENG